MKNLLSQTSTTYLGVIVAGVMSIARMAGYELVEDDVSNVVMLIALALIIIGRGKAKGPASWWTALFGGEPQKPGQSGYASLSLLHAVLMGVLGASLLLAALGASGCAGIQTTAPTLAYELSGTYIELHQDYRNAYDAADEDGRLWLKSQVAPYLDKAKGLLDAALTASIAGQSVENSDLSEVKAALTQAALALSDAIIWISEGK